MITWMQIKLISIILYIYYLIYNNYYLLLKMYSSIVFLIMATTMKLMLMIKKRWIIGVLFTIQNWIIYTEKYYFSLSLLNRVPCMPTCQRACATAWFTCQRANKHANVQQGVSMFSLGVPTYETTWQFFNLVYQRAEGCAKFSNIALTKC